MELHSNDNDKSSFQYKAKARLSIACSGLIVNCNKEEEDQACPAYFSCGHAVLLNILTG